MNSMTSTTIAQEAIEVLTAWLDQNGWSGYDPYDIQGQDWYVGLLGKPGWFWRKFRGALWLIETSLPPMPLRKLLCVPPAINAKAMGLLASAYLSLSVSMGRDDYRVKAEESLAWLLQNPSEGYPGISWGYPFQWLSRVLIPRGTPSAVVTGVVGDAFLDHYQLTGQFESLQTADRIAEFFLTGLNIYEADAERLCFSYTPVDRFRVHNANLFVAAFLARLGALEHNSTFLETALRSTRYTLSEQNADGSFYYWGSEPPTAIDHYHTGFVLRHLWTVYGATQNKAVLKGLELGYRFYVERLFTEAGVPKFTPDSLYPIDIHSCAEAILTLSLLGPQLGGLERLEPALAFTSRRMRSPEGYYFGEIRQRWGREQVVDIPYIRWGQAWMLLALARCIDSCSRLRNLNDD